MGTHFRSLYEIPPTAQYELNLGSALSQPLLFTAYACKVDNPTPQWVHITNTLQYIPPGVTGYVVPIPSLDVAAAEFVAPPGITQPASLPNQQAVLTYYSYELPPSGATLSVSLGTTLPQITVTGPADFQGVSTFEGSARFKGADPWFDVTHPAYGALGNGAANDTAAVQAAAAATSVGVVFFPPGTYLCDTLTLNNSQVWQGCGPNASKFKQVSDAGGHHQVVTAAAVTGGAIYDLGFLGSGTAAGNTYGVVIGANGAATRVRVEGCAFTGFSAGGIDIGGLIAGTNTDITIRACSFFDNAINLGQPVGIALTNGQRIRIVECDIQQSSADRAFAGANFGIDLEPNQDSDLIQDVTIANCNLRNTTSGIQVLVRATSLNQSKSVKIMGCSIWACVSDGVLLAQNGGKGVEVVGCDIHDNGRYGARIFGSDCTIADSRIVDNNRAGSAAGHVSIDSASSRNNTIIGCRIGYVDFAGAAQPFLIENVAGADYTLVLGCDVRTSSGAVSVTFVGTHSVARSCLGYNPVGAVPGGTPAFPATTVAQQNSKGVDVVAYVSNGANALTCNVDGVVLMVIPANQTGTVRVPAGSSFTPTYAGGAPTWTWYGE